MLTDWRYTITCEIVAAHTLRISFIMLMSIDSYWPFYYHRRIKSITVWLSSKKYVCDYLKIKSTYQQSFLRFCVFFSIWWRSCSTNLIIVIIVITITHSTSSKRVYLQFPQFDRFSFFARASEKAFWQMKCLLPSHSSSSSYILCVHNFKFPSKILYILKNYFFIISTTTYMCVRRLAQSVFEGKSAANEFKAF